MDTRYVTVTWNRLHRDAHALAHAVRSRAPEAAGWRGIVAVSRGGLVPAAIVARELGCRIVETACIASYDGEVRGNAVLTKPPVGAADGTGFLVIDDLADTGATLRLLRPLLPRAYFACLYAKPAGRDMAQSYVAEVPQETWIVFPWDVQPAPD